MAQSAPDHPFVHTLRTRFGGVLFSGKHDPDSQACVLEVASVARGEPWSDNPRAAALPDLRPLNDAPWSTDQTRTDALIPVVVALWDWPTWTETQRQHWVAKVAERTIREILPPILRQSGLSAEADRCEHEGTAAAAGAATWAAASAAAATAAAAQAAAAARAAAGAAAQAAAQAAEAATWAAAQAAEAAQAAAQAAAEAAAWAAAWAAAAAAWATITPDIVLQLACRIWIEEAHAITSEEST